MRSLPTRSALARLAGLLVLAAAALASVGCGNDAADATGAASVTAEGVRADLPAGWSSTRAYQPPRITDPVVRLAASSTPVRIRPRGCHVGAYRIPETAAMLVVLEWRHRELQPRDPRHPAAVEQADLRLRPGNVACFPGLGGSVEVADDGRVWGAYVMLGRRAPARLRAEALGVLRSLRATTPPSPLPGLFDTTSDLLIAGGRGWLASIRTVETRTMLHPDHRMEAFDPATLARVAEPVPLPAAWRLAGGPRRVWATGRGRLELIDLERREPVGPTAPPDADGPLGR